ncbi:MAG TPA: hypothetical protein VNX68_04255 [Nitrosopumilaceae archaeon]|nr:hypothetical protein [Nitrosopumilaceae archaeon]
MGKYTEEEFYSMDFTFFFKKENTVMEIASNGSMHEKFLELDKESQDKLFEYFSDLKNTSKWLMNAEAPAYPDASSFTGWAEKGVYAYDIDGDDEVLVAMPKTHLTVDSLPLEIRKLLTEF